MHDFGVPKDRSKYGVNTNLMKQSDCFNAVICCVVPTLIIVVIANLMCVMYHKSKVNRLRSTNVRENYTRGNRPADITPDREIFLWKALYGKKTMANGNEVPCSLPSDPIRKVYRAVKCYSSTGKPVADTVCASLRNKPLHETEVPKPSDTCSAYKWKTTYWVPFQSDADNPSMPYYPCGTGPTHNICGPGLGY